MQKLQCHYINLLLNDQHVSAVDCHPQGEQLSQTNNTMQVNCIPLSKGQYVYITSSVQSALAHKQRAVKIP
jgi:hypothetical protein